MAKKTEQNNCIIMTAPGTQSITGAMAAKLADEVLTGKNSIYIMLSGKYATFCKRANRQFMQYDEATDCGSFRVTKMETPTAQKILDECAGADTVFIDNITALQGFPYSLMPEAAKLFKAAGSFKAMYVGVVIPRKNGEPLRNVIELMSQQYKTKLVDITADDGEDSDVDEAASEQKNEGEHEGGETGQ